MMNRIVAVGSITIKQGIPREKSVFFVLTRCVNSIGLHLHQASPLRAASFLFTTYRHRDQNNGYTALDRTQAGDQATDDTKASSIKTVANLDALHHLPGILVLSIICSLQKHRYRLRWRRLRHPEDPPIFLFTFVGNILWWSAERVHLWIQCILHLSCVVRRRTEAGILAYPSE